MFMLLLKVSVYQAVECELKILEANKKKKSPKNFFSAHQVFVCVLVRFNKSWCSHSCLGAMFKCKISVPSAGVTAKELRYRITCIIRHVVPSAGLKVNGITGKPNVFIVCSFFIANLALSMMLHIYTHTI